MKTSRRDVNEILCPHCNEIIALEEGAYGLFDCPHCDEEFSWDNDRKRTIDKIIKWTHIVGAAMSVIGLIGVIGLLIWWQIDPPYGYEGLIIFFPIGIILIGLSINIIALMMFALNEIITIYDQTPPPEVIIFFGVTVVTIFCMIIFYLWFLDI